MIALLALMPMRHRALAGLQLDTSVHVTAEPPEQWVTTEVPELRVVEDSLWERVKARQGEIDAEPRVQATKATRFWEKRRKQHLLTGLLRCGCCCGGFAAVGKDYLACSAARKLGPARRSGPSSGQSWKRPSLTFCAIA